MRRFSIQCTLSLLLPKPLAQLTAVLPAVSMACNATKAPLTYEVFFVVVVNGPYEHIHVL